MRKGWAPLRVHCNWSKGSLQLQNGTSYLAGRATCLQLHHAPPTTLSLPCQALMTLAMSMGVSRKSSAPGRSCSLNRWHQTSEACSTLDQ